MKSGRWIDLDHVISITPAYFVDMMGRGGYLVEFNIEFMFRDKPIVYTFDCNDYLRNERREAISQKNLYASDEHQRWEIENVVPIIQKEVVDELVEEWKSK
jgi:hypothetical protein